MMRFPANGKEIGELVRREVLHIVYQVLDFARLQQFCDHDHSLISNKSQDEQSFGVAGYEPLSGV